MERFKKTEAYDRHERQVEKIVDGLRLLYSYMDAEKIDLGYMGHGVGVFARGRYFLWGTACDNWGADIYRTKVDFQHPCGSVETAVPSDDSDLNVVTEAMNKAMQEYKGEVRHGR